MNWRETIPCPEGYNEMDWEIAAGQAAYSLFPLHMANKDVPTLATSEEAMRRLFIARTQTIYTRMTEDGFMPYETRDESFRDTIGAIRDDFRRNVRERRR